ncbi:hypothetical protein MalM25_24090 [Planctomycetes bacterium MalM25]|nr:hypothetical protein MalM25_24090 [Planctomycetes bacterium MalM25]
MKPNNERPAPPPCGVEEARLEAHLTGEPPASDRDGLAAHLAECGSCAEAARLTASAQLALSQLPELRCPPRIIAAAEAAAAASVTPAGPSGGASGRIALLAVPLAVAASAALVWFTQPSLSPRPAEAVIRTRLDAEEAKQVLADLGETFRERAVTVKQKVYDRSLAEPVRKVVYVMTDSELGVLGAKAANLLWASEPTAPDAS